MITRAHQWPAGGLGKTYALCIGCVLGKFVRVYKTLHWQVIGGGLQVLALKALYGMLVASLLYYKKFREDISKIGFEVNPYDVCVANRIIHDNQHTIVWHVDDAHRP